MKVIHIVQGGVGGTLEYLKLLIPRLEKLGYENVVICHGEIYDELSKIGIRSINVEMSREISVKKDFISFSKILKVLKSNKPDICYLHSSKAGAIGRLACLFTRTRCVYNPHGWSFAMKTVDKSRPVYIIIEKLLSLFCNKIILISEAELCIAKSFGIASANKYIIINNGIDIDKISNASAVDRSIAFNSDENSIIIGMVGRLTEQKDPLSFVKISAEISKVITDAKFVIVGDGNLRDKAMDLARDLGILHKLIVTGWVRNPECYIKSFDIAVLTSKWEGFGLVLAEYMAAGKPIVASNVDGIPYVITDGYDGLLVNPGDINGFVHKIISLVEDNFLANWLVQNAKKTVESKFSIERVGTEHAQLFKQLTI